jgi:hypothetical protein
MRLHQHERRQKLGATGGVHLVQRKVRDVAAQGPTQGIVRLALPVTTTEGPISRRQRCRVGMLMPTSLASSAAPTPASSRHGGDQGMAGGIVARSHAQL